MSMYSKHVAATKQRLMLVFCSLQTAETMLDEARELTNMKRHSDGTFSNDYSNYMEERRAQDFVQWLMNSKRSG